MKNLHLATDGKIETVYVVDDDDAVRDSIQWLIEPEGYVVRAFEDPKLFLKTATFDGPSVVLLDVRMPKASGLEVQKALNEKNIQVPIVFITGHGDVGLAVETMKAGAADFLEKPFDEAKLKQVIHQNMQKSRDSFQNQQQDEKVNKLFSKLTSRELQVLERIVAGRLNKQIADDLSISIKTVEAHRANIMDKLQVTTVADLLKIALKKVDTLPQPGGV